jgi:hypothetical protein
MLVPAKSIQFNLFHPRIILHDMGQVKDAAFVHDVNSSAAFISATYFLFMTGHELNYYMNSNDLCYHSCPLLKSPMYVCMSVCIRGGPIGLCTATYGGLLCFRFYSSPQQSCASNETQDLVRGGVEIVTWFHKILAQVTQSPMS